MYTPLRSRLSITLCGAAMIIITTLYLLFAVVPVYTTLAELARANTIELGAASTSAGEWRAIVAQWSTLAMLALGLPCAVTLAFGASTTGRAISRPERVAWLLTSLLSLALFFTTAYRTQVFFDQLLG